MQVSISSKPVWTTLCAPLPLCSFIAPFPRVNTPVQIRSLMLGTGKFAISVHSGIAFKTPEDLKNVLIYAINVFKN